MNAQLTSLRSATLKEIWPDDERLRNAILMGMGCTDQLPTMNTALATQLHSLPKPGEDTVEYESLLHLALGDVLQWSARMEIALHDLRQSLFYRYNNRVRKMTAPDPKEEAAHVAASESVAAHIVPAPAPLPDKPKAKVGAEKISSLFGDLGKQPA